MDEVKRKRPMSELEHLRRRGIRPDWIWVTGSCSMCGRYLVAQCPQTETTRKQRTCPDCEPQRALW